MVTILNDCGPFLRFNFICILVGSTCGPSLCAVSVLIPMELALTPPEGMLRTHSLYSEDQPSSAAVVYPVPGIVLRLVRHIQRTQKRLRKSVYIPRCSEEQIEAFLNKDINQ